MLPIHPWVWSHLVEHGHLIRATPLKKTDHPFLAASSTARDGGLCVPPLCMMQCWLVDLALLSTAAVSLSVFGPAMSRGHYFAPVLPVLPLIVFLSFAPQCSLSLDGRKCDRHAQIMAKHTQNAYSLLTKAPLPPPSQNTYSLYLNHCESLKQPLSSTQRDLSNEGWDLHQSMGREMQM